MRRAQPATTSVPQRSLDPYWKVTCVVCGKSVLCVNPCHSCGQLVHPECKVGSFCHNCGRRRRESLAAHAAGLAGKRKERAQAETHPHSIAAHRNSFKPRTEAQVRIFTKVQGWSTEMPDKCDPLPSGSDVTWGGACTLPSRIYTASYNEVNVFGPSNLAFEAGFEPCVWGWRKG